MKHSEEHTRQTHIKKTLYVAVIAVLFSGYFFLITDYIFGHNFFLPNSLGGSLITIAITAIITSAIATKFGRAILQTCDKDHTWSS